MKKILKIFLLSTFVSPVFAQTNVGGVISSNTVWTITNSPYIVINNIVVLANLTIDAGVEVRFGAGLQLRIASSGSFNVNGSMIDSVTFTSNKITPAKGDWNQILIDGATSNVSMNYSKIIYADTGIHVVNSIANIKNTHIDQCNYGVYIKGASYYSFLDSCNVTNNDFGIYGNGAGWSQKISITNSNISDNNNSGIYGYESGFFVDNCRISNNIVNGIYCDFESDINNNVIAYNNIGILPSMGWINIFKNTLQNNTTGIKVGGYPKRTKINCNNFYNSSPYNLIYEGGYDDGEVDATNNYYSTSDTDSIQISIYDIFDDSNLGGYFKFTPFQTTPILANSLCAGTIIIEKIPEQFSVTVYPNPGKGKFTIRNNVSNISVIEIYNMLGEIIYKSTIKNPQSEIDISSQPNGIYFCIIQTTDAMVTKKLILRK